MSLHERRVGTSIAASLHSSPAAPPSRHKSATFEPGRRCVPRPTPWGLRCRRECHNYRCRHTAPFLVARHWVSRHLRSRRRALRRRRRRQIVPWQPARDAWPKRILARHSDYALARTHISRHHHVRSVPKPLAPGTVALNPSGPVTPKTLASGSLDRVQKRAPALKLARGRVVHMKSKRCKVRSRRGTVSGKGPMVHLNVAKGMPRPLRCVALAEWISCIARIQLW